MFQAGVPKYRAERMAKGESGRCVRLVTQNAYLTLQSGLAESKGARLTRPPSSTR